MAIEKKDLSQIDGNGDKEISSREIDNFLREYIWLKWISIDEFFDNKDWVWNDMQKQNLEKTIKDKLSQKTPEERQEYVEFFSQYTQWKYERNSRVEKLLNLLKDSLADLKQEVLATQPISKEEDKVDSTTVEYQETKYFDKKESKEEKNSINDPLIRHLLSDFHEEDKKMVFDNYLDDINVLSAIKVIKNNKWKPISSKTEWENAWYKCDWVFFWPDELKTLENLKNSYDINENAEICQKIDTIVELNEKWYDVNYWIKAHELLSQSDAKENIFKILCDYNLDGIVDNKDQWNITGQMLYDLISQLEKSMDKKTLYTNILKVMQAWWVDTKNVEPSKAWLHKLFVVKPYAMQTFVKQLETRWAWGLENVKYILESWSIKKSMDVRSKIEEKIQENEFFKEFKLWLENKYDTSLVRLKEWLDKVQDPVEKEKMEKIIAFLEKKENKAGIIESLRINGLWILVKLVENRSWIVWWTSITNDRINDYLRENSNDILKSLDLTLGFNYDSKWKFLPWIWLNLSYWGKINQDTEWLWSAWLILIVPYVAMGIERIINRDELNNAWLKDFSTPTESIWVAGNVALTLPVISFGWMVYYAKDVEKWIKEKKEQFTSIMNNVFNIEQSWLKSTEIINTIKENFNKEELSEEDKSYVSTIISNIEQSMTVYKFDELSDSQKRSYIEWIKKSYINMWESTTIQKQSQEWYKFAWVWVGLAFISGFFPMPIFGVKFQKLEQRFAEDKESGIISSLNLYYWAWQENQDMNNVDGFVKELSEKHLWDIKWLEIKNDNGKIILKSTEWKDILKLLNVNYTKNVSREIYYKNDTLVIWNVWMISLYKERTAKWRKHYLILGSNKIEWTSRISAWDDSFENNKPLTMVWSADITKDSSEYMNSSLENYIKTHINSIVWLPQRSPQLYKNFKKQLNDRNYEESAWSLIKLINSDKKLSKELSWETKELDNLMKFLKSKSAQKINIYSSDDPEIISSLNKAMYMVSQFNSAMMVDWQTKDKLSNEQERENTLPIYINQLYSKYPSLSVKKSDLENSAKEVLKDPSKWSKVNKKLRTIDAEMLSQPNYPWIDNNPNKKLYALLQPVKGLLNESFMWAENTNRREAFKNLCTANKLNVNTVLWYRDNVAEKFWNQADFKPLEEDKSILSFTWSYKLDASNKWRLSWGFDTVPPGVVSIAWWKERVQDITDTPTKEWIANNVSNSKYFDNMKRSISKYLTSRIWTPITLSNEQMIWLLKNDTIDVEWHKIGLQKQYIFFLYWMCGNESLWVRFKWLEIDWSWSAGNLVFNADWSVIMQTTKSETTNIALWATFGNENDRAWSWFAWSNAASTPWTVWGAPWSSGSSDE